MVKHGDMSSLLLEEGYKLKITIYQICRLELWEWGRFLQVYYINSVKLCPKAYTPDQGLLKFYNFIKSL